jgi:hypothetical protein
MKLPQIELSSGVMAFTVLFGATALQVFPIAGSGDSALMVKHLLILVLMVYLIFNVVLKDGGKLRASHELQVFLVLYAACIFSLLLNGLIRAPGPGYIGGFAELSYLFPLLFALYHFFDTQLEITEKFLRSVAILMFAAIVAFILFFAARANVDLIGALKGFASGTGTLQYHVFAMTFAYVSDDAGGAARHTMMYLFFILLVLIRASREIEGDPSRRASFTWMEFVLAMTIAIVGMSRKVVLSLLIFGVLYFFVSRRFLPSKGSFGRAKSIVLLAGLGIALMVGLGSVDSGALDLFWRKYVEQVLNNDRIHQYALAVVEVTGSTDNLIAGVGLGERIAGDTHFPHNILFYFFHQAGLIGLLSAFALFGFMGFLMFRSLSMALLSSCRNASYLALASLACYLVPFTRMSVGDKGGLAMEGVLGLTLGMVLMNRAIHASRHQPILIGQRSPPEQGYTIPN